jgi:CheY-like chemotaxis protein
MPRILVVDDENNIRLMIRLALQSAGFEVETASDGVEALEKWGDGARFDLVLLDHRMPFMEGADVLRAMKERDPAAKIILITAFGTIDLALEAMRAGATDFLRKPFTTEVLRDAVRAALAGSAPLFDAQQAPSPSRAGAPLSINGFRIENSGEAGQQVGDEIHQRFTVRASGGQSHPCTVILPRYFRELVQAHADRDALKPDERFWLWLGEEALANYLWQNAELPPGGTLHLEELSPNLRRWMDAVLTP